MIIDVIFWVCFAAVAYSYVGYAALLYVVPKYSVDFPGSGEESYRPTVTMIIAAYNEEAFVKKKVENALAVDYPRDRYAVVVVSDGSEDETNNIVAKIHDSRLTFLEIKERGGKASALNNALRAVDSEIVIFTDANVFLDSDAVSRLVDMLESAEVGAVTGRVELESIEEKEPLGEGAYMKYERFLQSLESSFWSVAGVDGALFAARRDLVVEIPNDTILDDFTIGFGIAIAGRRVLFQSDARAVEKVPAEVTQEFRRKTRIAAGSFQMLSRVDWKLLLKAPKKFQLSFFSHKVLRWYLPLFLAGLLLTNLFLLDHPIYIAALVSQIVIYAAAAAAYLLSSARQAMFPYAAYYFVAMNMALVVGWYRHIRSRQSVTWNRVDR